MLTQLGLTATAVKPSTPQLDFIVVLVFLEHSFNECSGQCLIYLFKTEQASIKQLFRVVNLFDGRLLCLGALF